MRNGLDISGVSEFVHEIGQKPVEAVIDFNTSAVPGARGAQVSVRPAHHGTQRMARSFSIPFTEGRIDPFAGLSAHEAAVAALGACVLITHVHGYSARAVTITSLRVTVSAVVEVDEQGRWVGGTPLHRLRYDIEADCDGPQESLTEVSQFVTCFSPNHRAFLDEGSFTLTAVARRADGSSESAPVPQAAATESAAAGGTSTVELTAELTWQYGTEASVTTMCSPGGELRRTQPSLTVDQAKQMAGIDNGPNPQEVLLAAVSADLCQELTRRARERQLPLHDVDVTSTGRLDIRGMLNVSPDIPARFHNLQFTVTADTELPAGELADLVAECAAANVTLATLRAAGTVEVSLRTPAQKLLSFRSDAGQVRDFLAVLAQKQAAAKASNALSASR